MATKVMGRWIQQFTCPECKMIGACTPFRGKGRFPLCHRCNYKVEMQPSSNGKILNTWEPPSTPDDPIEKKS